MLKKKLDIFIALIIFVLSFVSCSESATEKQDSVVLSRDFQGETWARFDFLEGTYAVSNAPMTADLVLEIDVTDDYPNVYPHPENDKAEFAITLSVNAPDGSGRNFDFSTRLKDNNGKFKSENVNGSYHFEITLLDDMSFGENGEYRFKIENKYSKDPLYGIKKLKVSLK